MQTEHTRRASRRRAIVGTLTAAAMLAAAALPLDAGAVLVEPHGATHIVTPQAAPAPISGPAPTSAASPSSPPVLNAGPGPTGRAPGSGSAERSGSTSGSPPAANGSSEAKDCGLSCLLKRKDQIVNALQANGDDGLSAMPHSFAAMRARQFRKELSELDAEIREAITREAPSLGSAPGSGSDGAAPSRLIDPDALSQCDVACISSWRDSTYAALVGSVNSNGLNSERTRFLAKEFSELDGYLQGRLGELAANPPSLTSPTGTARADAEIAEAMATIMREHRIAMAQIARERADAAAVEAAAAAAAERAQLADEMATAMGYGEPDKYYTEVTDQLIDEPTSEDWFSLNRAVEDGGGASGDR